MQGIGRVPYGTRGLKPKRPVVIVVYGGRVPYGTRGLKQV